MAAPRTSSSRLPSGIGVALAGRDDAEGAGLDHRGHGDEHRRQADHAVEEGDQLGHLGHLDRLGAVGAVAAADHQAEQHPAQAAAPLPPDELDDQRRGGQHGDRHADHAEQVAADRGGRVAQALQRLDEADAGDQVQQRDEVQAHLVLPLDRRGGLLVLLLEHLQHAPRDEEAAEDVDRGQRDRQHAHGLAERRLGERGGEHRADDDDRRDRVGHRHQRRVQRRA